MTSKKKTLRTRFAPPPRTQEKIEGSSMTQQQFKDEVDIRLIHTRYLKTGLAPADPRMPLYGDFSSMDFLQMQNRIVDAEQAFETLPAALRKRFKNDPYQFYRFMEDPNNATEAKTLGILY